jgi:hypothetical protein
VVERVRETLISSYAGAIMVGWTLAQGVTNLIALVLTPVMNLAVRYSNQPQRGFDPSAEIRIFDPIQLGVGAVRAAVVLGIGLMLLKWIYMPGSSSSIEHNLTETPE